MSQTPIKYGSIIHLKSDHDFYLGTLGWVKDIPSIASNQVNINMLVATSESENQSMDRDSWQILSAGGKALGKAVLVGDKIHLLNMNPGVGYLDSYEWVFKLSPFANYPMSNGVFTANDPMRGGGPTGTWTILSDTKVGKSELIENDAIYLENGFFGAGFLYTYIKEGESVTDHPEFSKHVGQKEFVFTKKDDQLIDGAQKRKGSEEKFQIPTFSNGGSGKWTITSGQQSEDTYYFVRGEIEEKWLDLGAFKFSDKTPPLIVALSINSPDNGSTLMGNIAYKGEEFVHILARYAGGDGGKNRYTIEHLASNDASGTQAKPTNHLNGEWELGGRFDKRIIGINISSADQGQTLSGTVTYNDGNGPINFKAVRANSKLFQPKTEQLQTNQINYFQPDLWKKRIDRIGESLDAAVEDFPHALLSPPKITIELIKETIKQAGMQIIDYLPDDTSLKAITDYFDAKRQSVGTPESATMTVRSADANFQVNQLLNIRNLSSNMKEFWDYFGDHTKLAIDELTDAQILPPVAQMQSCFREFTTDFEILQNAIRQRRWSADKKGVSQAESLIITDKLSFDAVAPFKHLITDSAHVIPITYYDQRIYVRQLPYSSQYIFIGLTYDLQFSISSAQAADTGAEYAMLDLMAIPHEVGHFMYDHAELTQDNEETTFAEMSQQLFADHPYRAWCEEIFADLYGCVVSGPFTVLGMQALLAAGDRDRVLKDDELHPTPIFRPYVLTEMLRIIHREDESEEHDYSDVADDLDRNWTAILERWGYIAENAPNGRPSRISLPFESDSHLGSIINVDQMIKNVTPILEAFAKALLYEKDDTLSSSIPWCKKDQSIAGVVKKLRELVDHKFIAESGAPQTLNSNHKLTHRLKKTIENISDKDFLHTSANIYLDILKGWHDSGPKSGNFGG